MIHTTVGVYNNLTVPFKSNGVKSENLAAHIRYNLACRPGRAFFVDGICLNAGYLSEKKLLLIQCRVDKIKHTTDTAPYH